MTPRERDDIERLDEIPDQAKPSVMDESCVACGCRVGDHWAQLHGDAIGWIGCAGALARKVTGAA